ncbi:hypothetical protein [Streptomyces sp. NPDC048172]|uniref:hypothetical protein n=1 Tax=Streptomyces sp. NPDC048172 TaxID=3365505 RepID=UPI003711716C
MTWTFSVAAGVAVGLSVVVWLARGLGCSSRLSFESQEQWSGVGVGGVVARGNSVYQVLVWCFTQLRSGFSVIESSVLWRSLWQRRMAS